MGSFLQIRRPPRRNRTCHPRCPVSTDTLKKQPTLEQLRKWSHSATFRLTAEMPLLGCRSHVGQSKSTKPVRCAHVFQHMAGTVEAGAERRFIAYKRTAATVLGSCSRQLLAEPEANPPS